MLTIAIPGGATLALEHMVLDFNGTIGLDGVLIPETVLPIKELAKHLAVHVLTADTHGNVAHQIAELPIDFHILQDSPQDMAKGAFIDRIGPHASVALGNGRNDAIMLARARLGIAVIGAEGCAVQALQQADLVCTSIQDGLDLLLTPTRLQATLRN